MEKHGKRNGYILYIPARERFGAVNVLSKSRRGEDFV
jgi:hypothetical protein